MTPTSQPFPRALFHPSRCAAPLRGRLPQRTGKGLRASSGEVVRLYRGQPNTTMPHKTLPLSSLDQNVPNMPGIVQTTPSQKPSSSQRTILFEFDKTCVFGRKVQSRGFHLKLIRLPVQNTRPPQGIGWSDKDLLYLHLAQIKFDHMNESWAWIFPYPPFITCPTGELFLFVAFPRAIE